MRQTTNELDAVTSGSTITFEGKERTVEASITLHELYQASRSSPWTRRGKVSRALVLAGNIVLVRLPSAESGSYFWLTCRLHRDTTNLREFYKGDTTPGPARQFAQNGQSEEIPYELFGKTWSVVDIGAIEANVDGECAWMKTNDRLYCVTSRCRNTKEWLWYVDARPGEAQGTGGAFVGVPFDPEEAIGIVL